MTMRHYAVPARSLPTTLGFTPIDDRARLPWRFFYRLIAGTRARV